MKNTLLLMMLLVALASCQKEPIELPQISTKVPTIDCIINDRTFHLDSTNVKVTEYPNYYNRYDYDQDGLKLQLIVRKNIIMHPSGFIDGNSFIIFEDGNPITISTCKDKPYEITYWNLEL